MLRSVEHYTAYVRWSSRIQEGGVIMTLKHFLGLLMFFGLTMFLNQIRASAVRTLRRDGWL